MAFGPDTAKLEAALAALLKNGGNSGWRERGVLSLDDYKITDLPQLPDWVWNLWLQRVPLKRITSKLPAGLKHITLEGSQIEELPELPEGLEELNVSNTPIKRLPKLPSSLVKLSISNTKIRSLPDTLPPNLRTINFSKTPIVRIHQLPPNLYMLACEDTNITELPSKLPRTIKHIYISRTKITVLPVLPAGLERVYASGTPLKIPYERWPQPLPMPAMYNKQAAAVREAWLERRRPQERCAAIKEELMAKTWSPERLAANLDAVGWDGIGC